MSETFSDQTSENTDMKLRSLDQSTKHSSVTSVPVEDEKSMIEYSKQQLVGVNKKKWSHD